VCYFVEGDYGSLTKKEIVSVFITFSAPPLVHVI
jgi:hypothetical protein